MYPVAPVTIGTFFMLLWESTYGDTSHSCPVKIKIMLLFPNAVVTARESSLILLKITDDESTHWRQRCEKLLMQRVLE